MKAQEAPASTNQDKKPIPVVNLRLNASSRALKDARDAFLRHEIVVVEGATTSDMRCGGQV